MSIKFYCDSCETEIPAGERGEATFKESFVLAAVDAHLTIELTAHSRLKKPDLCFDCAAAAMARALTSLVAKAKEAKATSVKVGA